MARTRKPCPHGLPAGYLCHKRRGETACSACLLAWRVYYQKRTGALPAFLRREKVEKARKMRRSASERKRDAKRSGRNLVPTGRQHGGKRVKGQSSEEL